MAKARDILKDLSHRELDRIIEMAWEDRTPFDAIKTQFNITEAEVIVIMRHQLKNSSFKMWRARVSGRTTKHRARRNGNTNRFRCSRQRHISENKIAKR